MLRRLLAQLGLTTLVMALGAGAVLADSPAPATPSSDGGQTVINSTNSNVVVSSTQTSTTSVGSNTSSQNGGGKGTPSAGSTPPSTGGSTEGDNQANATPAPIQTGATGQTISDSDVAAQAAPVPHDPGASQVPASLSSVGSILAASFGRATYIGGFSPIVPELAAAIPVASHHPPVPPASPVGLLDQLHILLISTLVPAHQVSFNLIKVAAHSQAGLLALPVLLLIAAASARAPAEAASDYTARLRRSGFLGAARSDVGDLLSVFATPREMGSIGAVVP